VILDYGLISLIQNYNSFGLEHTDENGVLINPNSKEDRFMSRSGQGLWLDGSLFNHSCIENANRVFRGDFMFVYANQHIPEGKEICLSYTPHSSLPKRQEVFESFGFICDCALCVAEKAIPQLRMDKLLSLESGGIEMQSRAISPDPKGCADLQTLVKKMKKEYGKVSVCHRLMLFYPLYILGTLLARSGQDQKAIDVFLEIFEVCGLDEASLMLGLIVGKTEETIFMPRDLCNIVSQLCRLYKDMGRGKMAEKLVLVLITIEKAQGLDAKMALAKHAPVLGN
jgi:hypothetical protein